MSETQRQIVALYDEDTGEIVSAYDVLDNVNEGVAMQMRETLMLAQRSRYHKYTCAVCRQSLRLRHLEYRDIDTWYFAHFPNSEDCPVKSESSCNPSSWADFYNKRFKESELHHQMMKNLNEVLSYDKTFTNILLKSRIYRPDITKEWRIPDVYSKRNGDEFAFEFQLYNTFISAIVDRNNFYRLTNINLLWFFPYFSLDNQDLCAKDIYYAHKRNVFVFDSSCFYNLDGHHPDRPSLPFDVNEYKFAYEESIKRNGLWINCYWQEPNIKNGRIKIQWHHKLVSLDELTIDQITHDVFYVDSDRLFYEKADDETKRLMDEWRAAKELRWKQIFDDIASERTIGLTVDISKIKEYQDPDTQLWGFKHESNIMIAARYTSVMPFNTAGVALVKKQKYWGAINILGKRVLDFRISNIEIINEDFYALNGDLYNKELHLVIRGKFNHYALMSDDYIEAFDDNSIISEDIYQALNEDNWIVCKGNSLIYSIDGTLLCEKCSAFKKMDDSHFLVCRIRCSYTPYAGEQKKAEYNIYNNKTKSYLGEWGTEYKFDKDSQLHIIKVIYQGITKEEKYDKDYKYVPEIVILNDYLLKGCYFNQWFLLDNNYNKLHPESEGFQEIKAYGFFIACRCKTGIILYSNKGELLEREYILQDIQVLPGNVFCTKSFTDYYGKNTGILDQYGHFIIKPEYSEITHKEINGKIFFLVEKTERQYSYWNSNNVSVKYGLLDIKGNSILECKYCELNVLKCKFGFDTQIINSEDGRRYLLLAKYESEYLFFNEEGKCIKHCEFIEWSKAMDGSIMVSMNERIWYPYSLEKGLLPRIVKKFENVSFLELKGNYAIKNQKQVSDLVYSSFEQCIIENTVFYRTRKKTTEGIKNGLYSNLGDAILPCIYSYIQIVHSDRYIVANNKEYALINEKGNALIDFSENKIEHINGYYVTNSGQSVYDNEGFLIVNLPDGFSFIKKFDDNHFVFAMGVERECGLCNKNGDIIIEAKYTKIERIEDDKYRVFWNKKKKRKMVEKGFSYYGNPYYHTRYVIDTEEKSKIVDLMHPSKLNDYTQEQISQFKSMYKEGHVHSCVVIKLTKFGAFVKLDTELISLLRYKDIKDSTKLSPGDKLNVIIKGVNAERQQVSIMFPADNEKINLFQSEIIVQ